jgi:Ca2+-binding RTX toxin-like protein
MRAGGGDIRIAVRPMCFVAAAALALAGAQRAHAASVTSAKETIAYAAAAGETNRVTIVRTPGSFRIFDAGATIAAGSGCAASAPGEVDCNADGIKRLTVRLGDGHDLLTLGVTVRTIVDGEAGNDTLEGGEGGDDLLGGPGDDRLFGGAGVDLLDGGEGADLISGGVSEEEFFGFDLALYETRRSSVRVTLDGAANDGEPGEGDNVLRDVEIVVGGSGDDELIGSAGPINGLFGGPGRDRIEGLGGNLDLLFGGRDEDLLLGGRGDDGLFTGPGNDVAVGDVGADGLFGGRGGDRLVAGRGRDVVDGGSGDDVVRGGPQPDHVYGGTGRDRVGGGSGADQLFSRDGERDSVSGGSGRDCGRLDRRLDRTSGIECLLGQQASGALSGRVRLAARMAAVAARR